MSLPEIQRILKEQAEHDFAFDIGDEVFLRTDKEYKYPMIITGFDLDDYDCNDYKTSWLNSQGTEEIGYFPEEALTQKTEDNG